MRGRLDDEKLETLRSWGTGLSADDRDELRAAGKAILILVDEIEQLQVDVWHARQEGPTPDGEPSDFVPPARAERAVSAGEGGDPGALDTTLRGRLGRLLPARAPDPG